MGQQAPHNKRVQAVNQALLKKHIPEELNFDLKAVFGAISEVHKLSINLPDSVAGQRGLLKKPLCLE